MARLTREQYLARAAAWTEAADHLRMAWTEDEEEIHQGHTIATYCENRADELMEKASKLKRWKCACGFSGDRNNLIASPSGGLCCPECGGSGGLI